MKKINAFVLALFLSCGALAQENQALFPAGITVAGFRSVFDNQAGLAGIKTCSIGCSADNRFMIKELGRQVCALVLPLRVAVLSTAYTRYGYEKFMQEKTGLALARKFGKLFTASVQLDYLFARIAEGYGSASAWAFEAGFRCEVRRDLVFAGHIFNPVTGSMPELVRECYPPLSRFGLAWQPNPDVSARFEFRQCLYQSPELCLAVECRCKETASCWLGFTPAPVSLGFGFGIKAGAINLRIASSWDPLLGYSPGMEMDYHLKNQRYEIF